MFPPTGSGGEVASLDNTGWKEDLGVFQMNDLQTGRTLQITCSGRSEGLRTFNMVELTVDDQNLLGSLLLGQSIEDGIHGLTVPPHDTSAAAAALDRLCGDPALRNAMGRAASELFSSSLTWDSHARRMIEIFHAAVAAT